MIYSKKCFRLKRKLLIILVAQLSLFGACINNTGYITGPYEVEALNRYQFEYQGDEVQDNSAMRWEVTQGNLVTNYDGETLLHTFSEDGQQAQIRLFLVNSKGTQRGKALVKDVRINPWVYRVLVRDLEGKVQKDVEVSIYADLACATGKDKELCLIERQLSNSQGVAVFEKLRPNESYAVFARGAIYESNLDPETNHESLLFSSALQEEAEQVALEVSLRANLISALVNTKFELWDITDGQGQSVWLRIPECKRDNFVQFDAHLNWRLAEGVDSCSQAFAASGSYQNDTYFGGAHFITITNTNYVGTAFLQSFILDDENNLQMNTIESGIVRRYHFRRIGN